MKNERQWYVVKRNGKLAVGFPDPLVSLVTVEYMDTGERETFYETQLEPVTNDTEQTS